MQDRSHSRRYHTTSKSVQGVYEEQQDETFMITHGYSKDHRPDLKQLKIGLGVQQNGLPLFGEVFSGNVSDQKWSFETVQMMSAFFEEKGQRAPFVLDSSLVTKTNLKLMEKEKIQFLSRVPDTFGMTESAKEEAMRSSEWTAFQSPTGKEYRLYTTKGMACEQQKTAYPLLFVWSKELAAKKENTLQKKWAKMQEKLTKQLAKKEKVTFSSEADVRMAMEENIRLIHEKGFSVKGQIVSATAKHHPGRGRPKKDEIAEEVTTFSLSFSGLQVHPSFSEREWHMASCFVLINSPELRLPAEEKLLLYKKQSRVETRFRLLKDPMLFHNVYLKNSRRVKVLGYVFYLVLLLFVEWAGFDLSILIIPIVDMKQYTR
ncbi:IS1634 family transposase [Domibacillus tundrae]|uniref:IS1634 family transposase n=1 Tax=Domibacillus tundrae TaxID=1587527 RepID=UPI003398AEB8